MDRAGITVMIYLTTIQISKLALIEETSVLQISMSINLSIFLAIRT
jgi:hypothetical protein